MSVLHLQFTRPDGETELYHLKGVRPYHIGRGSQCEIRILDMKMSRQHCLLEERDGDWLAADLGSTNGVKVDGVKIAEPTPLQADMRLGIGLSELVVANINDSLEMDAEDMVDADFDQPTVDKGASPDPAAVETASLLRHDSDEIRTVEQDALPEVDDDVPTVVPDNDWDAEPHSDETSENAAVLIPTTSRHQHEDKVTNTESLMRSTTSERREATGPKELTQHYIRLLGRRFGPLTRAQARALKAKELKGDLGDADLKDLPEA